MGDWWSRFISQGYPLGIPMLMTKFVQWMSPIMPETRQSSYPRLRITFPLIGHINPPLFRLSNRHIWIFISRATAAKEESPGGELCRGTRQQKKNQPIAIFPSNDSPNPDWEWFLFSSWDRFHHFLCARPGWGGSLPRVIAPEWMEAIING